METKKEIVMTRICGRVSPEVRRAVRIAAATVDESLEDWVAAAIKTRLRSEAEATK